MNIPKITREHAAKFQTSWLFHGKIAVVIDDASLDFAADFASFVLQSVLGQYAAEQEAERKRLVVTE